MSLRTPLDGTEAHEMDSSPPDPARAITPRGRMTVPKPGDPRKRSLGRRLVLSLLPLLPLYILSEVVLSTIDYPLFADVPESTMFIDAAQKLSPWGELRWVAERVYLGMQTTFELPYNCRAFLPPKTPPAGAKRLVFIGDSVMFGAGVEEYETMPFYLTAYLNRYRARPVVDMVNLGIPGADTLTYLRTLPVAILYQPDLIVLSFTASNDGEINTYFSDHVLPPLRSLNVPLVEPILVPETVRLLQQKLPPRRISNVLRNFRDAFLTHSRTLTALFMLARPFESKLRQNIYMKRTLGNSERWDAVRSNLVTTIDFFHSRKIPVVVLVYPHIFASHRIGLNDVEQYPYGEYHLMVKNLMKQENVPVIDLLDYFRAEKVRSLDAYSVDGDGHPNGAFNALVARHFATDLLGPLGFFKQSPATSVPSRAPVPR